jgi:hypothetical protein
MAKNYRQMTQREKLAYLKALSDNAAKRVQGTKADWREFLRFYAKLYKYPFSEALLIYEQAPNTTACGEVKHWNMVGRSVHRGKRGIPIINERDMEIHYVFDVSDTHGEERGIPRRWSLPERYMGAVAAELVSRFRVPPPTGSQRKNLKWVVEEYTRECCADHTDSLRRNFEGSLLAELGDGSLGKRFTNTVVDSVGYLVSVRLEIAQGLYADDEMSFEFLSEFNTKAALYQVGVAAGQISRSVLTLIAQTIQNQIKIERVTNNDERRTVYERGSDRGVVDDSRGNRGSGESSERAATPDGQIRQPVLGISERKPFGPAQLSAGGNDVAGRVPRSGQRGAGDDGNADAQAPRQDAAAERRLHGGGALRDGDPGPGGGNRTPRDRVQTEVEPKISEEKEAEGESSPLSPSQGENRSESHIYNQYINIFIERVRNDKAYINACQNSDEQNARTECAAAVKRVMNSLGISDIELYKAYFDIPVLMDDSFQNRIKDHVFGMTYEPLSKAPDSPQTNSTQHRNYRALASLAPEIVNGEAMYMHFMAGKAFMPLSIDRLSGDRISLSHYYRQSGDMMADPDMEFVIDREADTLSARTYQQDNRGLYQSADGDDGGIKDERLARRLDSFARQWLSNIKSQGYININSLKF